MSRRSGEGAKTADCNDGRAVNGIGPYRFVQWARRDRVTMARNETCRGGPAPWSRVVLRNVAQMLARAGVRTTVDAMAHAMHLTCSRNRVFSFLAGLWGVETGEPTTRSATLIATVDEGRGRGQFNLGRYSNAAFDALLDQALGTMADGPRERLLAQATEVAFTDVALIPLHHQFNIRGHRRGLTHDARIDGYTRAMSVQPPP